MLLDGTLYPYCHDIEQQAQEQYDILMVRRMNLPRVEAEHSIFAELLSLS